MNIFLATPISSYRDAKALRNYKKDVNKLITQLKKRYEVVSEIEKINNDDDYDLPEESIKNDFESIGSCDVFLMHYPIKIPTSALIELGYALACGKRVIIVAPSINDLPYLAQGLQAINIHSKIIEREQLSEAIEEILMLLSEC